MAAKLLDGGVKPPHASLAIEDPFLLEVDCEPHDVDAALEPLLPAESDPAFDEDGLEGRAEGLAVGTVPEQHRRIVHVAGSEGSTCPKERSASPVPKNLGVCAVWCEPLPSECIEKCSDQDRLAEEQTP